MNALNRCAFEFNWLPSNYIDETWLADWITRDALFQVRQHTHACQALNLFLFEQFNLSGEVQENECDDQLLQRILQPSFDVHKLILFAGMALNYTLICQIICGQEQRKLRHSVGEEAYDFATNRASFLFDGDILQRMFSSKRLSMKNGHVEEVMHTGLQLFWYVSDTFSEAIKSRLILKFKYKYAAYLKQCWDKGGCTVTPGDEIDSSVKTKAEAFLMKVTKELYPQ